MLLLVAACAPQLCVDTPDRALCLVDEAVERVDVNICKQVENPQLQDYCVSEVALSQQNIDVCTRIADKRTVDYCKRDIYLAMNNTAGCDGLLPDARNSCYDSFARERVQWRLCSDMERGSFREKCLYDVARAAVDPQGCLALPRTSIYRDGCLFSTSTKVNTVATCLEIEDANLETSCVSIVAVSLGDQSLCEQAALPQQCNAIYNAETR